MRRHRIIIDASGAPAGSGGMQLYAREMLLGWLESFPDDNVVIFGARWLGKDLARSGSTFLFVTWPNRQFFLRILGQLVVVPLLFLFLRRTRLLALNAVVSPVVPGGLFTIIAHDWRHLRNPEEFSRAQRIYRRLWLASGRRARNAIAVSTKTLRESEQILDRDDVQLVAHGGTHPSGWKGVDPRTPSSSMSVVTFGHQSNKRPGLVIAAFIEAMEKNAQLDEARLTVLGLNPSHLSEADETLFLAHRDKIELPGFVQSEEYQRIISSASLIVLASSDEGFGFPAIEASFFGIPCLVADDSGLSEIHGAKVVAVPPEIGAFSQTMLSLLLGKERSSPPDRSQRPWSEVARDTRGIVLRDARLCHNMNTSDVADSSGDIGPTVMPTQWMGPVEFGFSSPTSASVELISLEKTESGDHVHLADAFTAALSDKSADYRKTLRSPAINFPDGKPIGWISAAKGHSPKFRKVWGSKLFRDVFNHGRSDRVKRYFFASTSETLKLLVANLNKPFPMVEIVGSESLLFRTPELWGVKGGGRADQ